MIIVALAVLGVVLGSFVNALVWRLHEQSKSKQSATPKELSILKGRSLCPDCRHVLAARDLVPVASWLFLSGRCRYCRQPISRQYPLVEVTTALLVVASYLWWPASLDGVQAIRLSFWLVFLTGFMALTVYDLRWMLLPHRVVYPLVGLALLQWVAIWLTGGLTEAGVQVAGIGLSALVGGGLFYLLFQASDGKWIGGGDIKLGFLLGLIVADPLLSWLMLFLAALIGSLVTIPLLAIGKATRRTRIPFGPFLMVGCFLVVLFGQAIIGWFERQALL